MKTRTALAIIGLLFTAALFVKIGSPFTRHREGICTQYALMAQNHVALGYGQTRFASYEMAAIDPAMYDNWRAYSYPNRPFLSVVATSVWFRLFGDGEGVLRLSLIVAALGAWLAFVALARKLVDQARVPLAAALFAFNPMFWYFSIVAVHLTYALAFSMAAWACWVRWEEQRRFRILTFVFLFLACESDWPGYYATLSIALDAVLQKRRALACAMFSVGLVCFGLHVLHLWWLDPPLVLKLLRAGSERSIEGLPGPFAFLFGEAREMGLYFTAGMVLLALAGLRRLPRRVWLLALLGLDEVLLIRWAHEHDFLSYPLVPFVVLAAVHGVETLKKPVAVALLALAALQSLWITGDRLTRTGAYEVYRRAGLAIREGTRPDDRVLLTMPDVRQYTPYYARRYTVAREQSGPDIMDHPSGRRWPAPTVDDLENHFPHFSVVVVGDPEMSRKDFDTFGWSFDPERFGFLGSGHPLRRKLEARAVSKEARGAFVLYRLR